MGSLGSVSTGSKDDNLADTDRPIIRQLIDRNELVFSSRKDAIFGSDRLLVSNRTMNGRDASTGRHDGTSLAPTNSLNDGIPLIQWCPC